MDGSLEKLEWAMDMAAKYDIKVLLDVHSLKDSQNGFDNSGKATQWIWVNETSWQHWPVREAHWMGEWDSTNEEYTYINYDNIEWGLKNVRNLMQHFKDHSALYAFEPVNEPWESSPNDTLSYYYREARNIVHNMRPDVIFLFHDSFHFTTDWNYLFPDDDMENIALDTHYYQAWNLKNESGLEGYC